MRRSLTLIFAFALCAQAARAQLLVAHEGGVNPQLEGWNRAASGFPQPIGAAVFDGPIAAWEVDKTVVNSSLGYSYTIGAANLLVAKQQGWSYSFNLLVAEYPSPPDNSIFFQVDTNGEVWNGRIGATASGDPIFQFGYGSYPAYTVASGGGQYHDYDLVYNPAEENLDLFIDGTLRLANIDGGLSGPNNPATGSVAWGANAFSGTGSGHWNSVEFSITPTPVPEPASFGIYGAGVLMSLGLFRKKLGKK